ncbi:MAG TPA: hypothetical protein VH592_02010 [Gemmataceae bacterium]
MTLPGASSRARVFSMPVHPLQQLADGQAQPLRRPQNLLGPLRPGCRVEQTLCVAHPPPRVLVAQEPSVEVTQSHSVEPVSILEQPQRGVVPLGTPVGTDMPVTGTGDQFQVCWRLSEYLLQMGTDPGTRAEPVLGIGAVVLAAQVMAGRRPYDWLEPLRAARQHCRPHHDARGVPAAVQVARRLHPKPAWPWDGHDPCFPSSIVSTASLTALENGS